MVLPLLRLAPRSRCNTRSRWTFHTILRRKQQLASCATARWMSMKADLQEVEKESDVRIDRFLLFAPWDEYRAKLETKKNLGKDEKRENTTMIVAQSELQQQQRQQLSLRDDNTVVSPTTIEQEEQQSAPVIATPPPQPSQTTAKPMFDMSLAPLYHLHIYYRKNYNKTEVPDNLFTVTSESWTGLNAQGHNVRVLVWTASFQCPITGQTYVAGTLRDENRGNVGAIGRKKWIYYNKLVNAKHAAAGRFLDLLQFQSTGLVEPRFCKEDPQLEPLQDSQRQLLVTDDLAPMEKLVKYYKEKHAIDLDIEDVFQSESKIFTKDDYSETVWNSTFTCPVTGTQYSSWRDPMYENDIATLAKNDDKVYHRKKRVSRLAAASKAIDALLSMGKKDQVQNLEGNRSNKNTEKDSVKLHTSSSSRNAVFFLPVPGSQSVQQLPNTEDDVPTKPDLSEIFFNTMEKTEFRDNAIIDESTPLFQTGKEGDDADNFFVSRIPSIVASPPSQRLLSVATDAASYQNTSRTSRSTIQSVIHAARAWLEVNSEKSDKQLADLGGIHRVVLKNDNSNATAQVGKTLLASLTMANQCTPIGFKIGVEKIAENILDVLWSSENDYPDADTYSLYIKCFDQETPKIAKCKAEQLIEDMKNGKRYRESGKVLPKPNQRVFNALIQISAQVGGTTGRYANHIDEDFRPDRESFLSVLSSAIYPAAEEFEVGGFDLEFARECIKRMYELSKELNDSSLKPDHQVYNAPLRWASAPKLWFASRPYARCIPWDNYEALYSKGLRDSFENDDIRFKQAKEMEIWLDEMEKGAVDATSSPNIETYEAVIQGWLRTVSRKGLEQAEKVALRIIQKSKNGSSTISESMLPRVQTFHPILAAWYHSGEPDAAAKMLEWISHYENTRCESETLDSRVIEMKMIAYGMEQEKILEEIDSSGINDNLLQRMVSAAVSCSNALKLASSRPTNQQGNSQILEVILFSLTAKTWKNVASCARRGDSEFYHLVLSELFQLAALFDEYIRVVVEAETSQGVSFKSDDLSTQLAHIVSNAHQFYHILVDVFIEIEQGYQTMHIDAVGERTRTILLIEKMLRNIGELEELSHEFPDILSEKGAKKRVIHDDRFFYHTKPRDVALLLPSRLAFLWQAVKYLETTPLEDFNQGDIIRLCLLIKNVDLARKTAGKVETAIEKILERVLPDFDLERDLEPKLGAVKRHHAKRGRSRHGYHERHGGKVSKPKHQRRKSENVKSISNPKKPDTTKSRKLSDVA